MRLKLLYNLHLLLERLEIEAQCQQRLGKLRVTVGAGLKIGHINTYADLFDLAAIHMHRHLPYIHLGRKSVYALKSRKVSGCFFVYTAKVALSLVA